MRRGEQTAMAERTRSEFAGAIHPPHDATRGEVAGNTFDEQAVLELVHVLVILARGAREMGAIDRRTPEGMIRHVTIRVVKVNPIGIQRRAQCAPGISRR